MTSPEHRCAHARRDRAGVLAGVLAGLVLALSLLGCGPGTGGTGTGPGHGTILPGAEPTPDQAAWFLGRWEGLNTQALWEADRIRIVQGCVAVQSTGAWKPDAAGEVRLAVQIGQNIGIASQQGQLTATAQPGRVMLVQVRTAEGNTVIAPTELRLLADARPLPPGC